MIAYSLNATQICADVVNAASGSLVPMTVDQLTEGDIIRHFTGEIWEDTLPGVSPGTRDVRKVISEPEYTCSGICSEILCLDLEALPNTQTVVFAPRWRFELLDHQSVMTV